MGFMDKFKEIMNVPDDDELDEEFEDVEENEPPKKKRYTEEAQQPTPPPKKTEYQRQSTRGKTVPFNQNQMQVVLVKPDGFGDVTAIADHLNQRKTVVLNLETADRENSRRIIDFLSGVAYANNGNVKKVAKATFIIVPTSVDVMGELMLDDYDETKLY